MPNAMTFTSLCEDVAKYLERGGAEDADVKAQIPALVNMAERRIARDMKVDGLQATVTSTLTAGKSVYEKPDRWRDTVSINFGAGTTKDRRTPIFARSYEYVRNYWPDEALTGLPRFYADYDSQHWVVAPTPDADYPMELLYHQMDKLLDDANQSNWITRYAPNALLYATLAELTLFIRAFDTLQVWEGKYKESLGAINAEEAQQMADRAATRQGS